MLPILIIVPQIKTGLTHKVSTISLIQSTPSNKQESKVKVDGGRCNGFCLTITEISCLVVGSFHGVVQLPRNDRRDGVVVRASAS